MVLRCITHHRAAQAARRRASFFFEGGLLSLFYGLGFGLLRSCLAWVRPNSVSDGGINDRSLSKYSFSFKYSFGFSPSFGHQPN
jgi:hypothetical protein